jgi:hypothetical protein
MISCKQATDFISRKEEGKLSFRQRLQLWQHLAVCSFCKLFYKQNKIFSNTIPHLHEHISATLTAEQKESLIKALENS